MMNNNNQHIWQTRNIGGDLYTEFPNTPSTYRISPVNTDTFITFADLQTQAPNFLAHLANVINGWNVQSDLVVTGLTASLRDELYTAFSLSEYHLGYSNHVFIPQPQAGQDLLLHGWSQGVTSMMSTPLEYPDVQFSPGVDTVLPNGHLIWSQPSELFLTTGITNPGKQGGLVFSTNDAGEIVLRPQLQIFGSKTLTVYRRYLQSVWCGAADSLLTYWVAASWINSPTTTGSYKYKGHCIPRTSSTEFVAPMSVGLTGWAALSGDLTVSDMWSGSYVHDAKQYCMSAHVVPEHNAQNPGTALFSLVHKTLIGCNMSLSLDPLLGRYTDMDTGAKAYPFTFAGGSVTNVTAKTEPWNASVVAELTINNTAAGTSLFMTNGTSSDFGSEPSTGHVDGQLVSLMLLQGGVVNVCGDVGWELV